MDYSFHYEYESHDLTLYYAKQSDIDNFDFNKKIDYLIINGDYIDTLIIPDGVKYVSVDNLGLKYLYVPDSVETLYANNNFLSSIELPENICKVCLNNNLLTKITSRGNNMMNLFCLEVEDNRLSTIDINIPDTIEVLRIRKNNNIHIDEKMKTIINRLDDIDL